MSSEDMSLVASQRLQNGLGSHHHHHQIVYQDDEALRFNCVVAPAANQRRAVGEKSAGIPKTRDLSGFIDERFFAATPDFRREIYGGDRPEPRSWSGAVGATPSVDGSDEDEEEENDDEDDDEDEPDGKGNGGNNATNGEDNIGNGKQKRHNNNNNNNDNNDHLHNHHHFGVNVMVGEGSSMMEKESGNVASTVTVTNNNNNNVVTVAENETYLSQYYQRGEGSRQKDSGAENNCGFSGRREACLYSNESGESLRAILSDPLTGALMDDAMILPCGHSFGGGGIQHVMRMKSCFTCSQSISEDSAAPNLSLRAAVQAFRREEESQFQRSAKRKRERFDQDKAVYGDSNLMETPRGRGVQFPFAVTDRVIIKGNKRTPQRFVGREAVVTTQCLNGWYVVKTLDNAESVKLQYRSLAKLSDDPLAKPVSTKMPPNWL